MKAQCITRNDQGSKYEWILMMYIAIKPLYIFGSGGMQISDMFLALCFGWILIQSRHSVIIPVEGKKWFDRLLLFTIYIVFVNALWYLWLIGSGVKSSTFISSILYYSFNVIAVIICMNVIYRVGIDRTIKGVMNGATISSLIVFLGVLLNMGKGERNTSFFNNPNQLGFYAIILLTFVCFFSDYIDRKKNAIIVISALIAVVVSLSKASFVSAFVLGFFYLISRKSKTPQKMIAKGGMLVLLGVVLYVFLYGDISLVNNNVTLYGLRHRILNMAHENDSNLGTGRGYNRVFEMGYNLVWGMGEGGYDRFSVLRGYEIHSTYANMLVSYGIIGSIISLVVFAMPLKCNRNLFRNICCFSGVLMYCISHNGIRNTVIWVLLSLLIFLNSSCDNTQTNTLEK